MNTLKYAEAIRKHVWLVAGCLVLTIAAAGLASLLMTPVYSANAQLFVAARDQSPYQGQLFSQQRVRSYADIVNSPQVMSAVVAKLGLSTTPEKLAAKVSADVPPETVLITVTVRDTSPRRAQAIANTTTAEFSQFVRRIERTEPGRPSPVTINIVKPASLPTTPSSPRTVLNLGLGLLVGLFLGVGGALLSESLHPSPSTSEDGSTSIPFGTRRRSALGDAEEYRRDGTDVHLRSIRRS